MAAKNIFIVEDEIIVAQDLKLSLVRNGYNVVGIARNGEVAIRMIMDDQPDLVLMDIVLAGKMNGIETSKKITSRFNIPIVYLTAYADMKMVKKVKVTCPYGYILKPFDIKNLLRTVELALYKHKMELNLKESETKYRTLVETSLLGVAIVQGTQVVFTNNAFRKILDLKPRMPSSFGSVQLARIVFIEDRPYVLKQIRSIVQGNDPEAIYSCRIISKRNRLQWIEFTINQIEFRSNRALQFTVIDITKRKQFEERLQQTQKIETLTQLSASIAHQLNTPLAVISTRLQMLEDDFKQMHQLKHAKKIHKIYSSAEKMSNIIRTILNYSRRFEGHRQRSAVNDLILEIVNFIEINAKKRGIRIVKKLGNNLPYIIVERNKIEQVFLNIIMNAMEAMNAGGCLKVNSKSVEKNNDHFVEIRFIDDGCGMDEKTLSNLFEPFFTTKPAGKGTGLGMFISAEMIKEHNGRISARSKIEVGTEIKILIPVAEQSRRHKEGSR
jgi:two-component system cell cycle sensor histidine kinase/response regulator CckA